MYDQLEALWRRMGVDEDVMDGFVEANRGTTPPVVQAYEEELERMIDLKRERMGEFIANARTEIESLWEELMVGEIDSLIELKTHAVHRKIDWAEIYPQLYLSQIAFFYIAKHDRGNFNTLEKVELGLESMQTHARRAEQGVAKLKLVLQDILDAAKRKTRG
jgi:hypothetical protein